jgi:hypothetical protein
LVYDTGFYLTGEVTALMETFVKDNLLELRQALSVLRFDLDGELLAAAKTQSPTVRQRSKDNGGGECFKNIYL